ncbi:MAG: type II secretion system protein, partial [Planctomycetes bacterium]|nr:type II secretion system protein [Planctomycetota bacterium]
MRNRQNRTGFTLIELLVVIAIIAVLISILLPSLKLARDQAKQVLCNTNLRAMGEAAEFYRAEYDDWFVRHNDDEYRVNFASSFMVNLKPHKRIEEWDGRVLNLWDPGRQSRLINVIKEVPQFQCPSHPDPKQPLDYVVSGFPWPYTRQHHALDGQY